MGSGSRAVNRRHRVEGTRKAGSQGGFGLFAASAEAIPPLSGSERAARPWSAIWRVLAVLVMLAACTAAQALGYDHFEGNPASPGLLVPLGIGWDTWYGFALLLAVFAVGGLAPMLMGFLPLLARWGRFRPLVALAAACMALVWSIPAGNAIGQSLWWIRGLQEGRFYQLPSDIGFLSWLPGVAVAVGAVVAVPILWLVLDKHGWLRGARSGRIARLAGAAVPLACMIAAVASGALPSWGQGLLGASVLAVYLGTVMPNELSAAVRVIRTGRAAYWLWPFAIIIVWEALMMVYLVVAAIYQL